MIFKKLSIALLSIAFCLTSLYSQTSQPNIVIIFLDDSGYGDFNPFGKTTYPTPNVEQLAKEGTSYTQFYVPQAICSASRSALLSGCYPARTKVFGAHGPNGHGLDPKFATLPEMLKQAGYSTAHFGKWHCGDKPETRPIARGFDEHAGIMYSNDMWKHHPGNPIKWGKFPLKFWENGNVKVPDVDHIHQENFTQDLTRYATDFINKQSKDKPFFLYLAHPQPHVPLYVSKKFKGKSGQGLYADVMMEIDWSVGKVNQALKNKGFDKNTVFIFSSDNGPWVSYGDHAGKTPFREAKATSFDGGMRVACIVKYPEVIKANHKSKRMFFSIDFMPTLLHWANAPLPQNKIDGLNVAPWITGKANSNPHDYYGFTISKSAQGAISGDGKWKLHLPHGYRTLSEPGKDGLPGTYKNLKQPLALYNMVDDPLESKDVKNQYPEIAEQLKEYAEKHAELVKSPL